MKQIIVITRIDHTLSEFPGLYPGRMEPVTEEYDEYSLIVYDGKLIYDDEIDKMADKIIALVNGEAQEVLIVIHYASFDELSRTLLGRNTSANWRVVEYSGSYRNYTTDIKPALQGVIADNKAVERIYRLFTYDPILEAKLNLLHNCILSVNVTQLDDLLSQYQSTFEIFKKKVAGVSWHKPEYVTALAELRDSLLGI